MEGRKKCSRCGITKPLTEFSWRDSNRTKPQSYCLDCAREGMEAVVWGRAEPGEASRSARSSPATSDRSESAAYCGVEESPVRRLWGALPSPCHGLRPHQRRQTGGGVIFRLLVEHRDPLGRSREVPRGVRQLPSNQDACQTEHPDEGLMIPNHGARGKIVRFDLLRGCGRRGLQFPADGM